MGELILCSQQLAAMPYYIENVSLNVYSLDELCYYIKNNTCLLDADFMDDELCDIPQTGSPSVGAAEGLQEVTAGYLHHVENVAVNELGGLGDAMCSAVGTGLYKDFQEAFDHMSKPGKRFEPRID